MLAKWSGHQKRNPLELGGADNSAPGGAVCNLVLLVEALNTRGPLYLPVNSIEHFNCDQDRQSHCHWFGVIENVAINAREHPGLSWALHVMRLSR